MMSGGQQDYSRLHTTKVGVDKANAWRNTASPGKQPEVRVSKAVAGSLVDFTLILSLVFGGCCANVWTYEHLLKMDSRLGTTLTFSQMCFITLHSLPSFVRFDDQSWFPRLQRRHVPIRTWAAQVLVLTSSSLLGNWAYAFQVPLTVQIVFRSGGLAVSMFYGCIFFKRRYSLAQIGAVALVTAGVILATLSRPSTSSTPGEPVIFGRYLLGVLMMTASLLLIGILGMLQERTYTTYGPYWKEGVFYTHLLSLPIFVFLLPELKNGFTSLSQHAMIAAMPSPSLVSDRIATYKPYLILAGNLVTQLMCVSAVNQLTSRVTQVSTNIVLTTRKAISLCVSVWWFGNGFNAELGIGAAMVFAGSILYTWFTTDDKKGVELVPESEPEPKSPASRESPV